MRAAHALFLLTLASCVDRVAPPELVSRLSVLAVQADPGQVMVYAQMPNLPGDNPPVTRIVPIRLLTLAVNRQGIAGDATFEYGLCGPDPLPPSGPPDCLPPRGTALPVEHELGVLDLASAAPWLSQLPDGGWPALTFYLSVRARSGGEEAVALRRVAVESYDDRVYAGRLTVDGVRLDGVRRVRVTQGVHRLEVRPECSLSPECDVAWYVTGGSPARTPTLLGESNRGPVFEWVAPAEAGDVVVVAVVRSAYRAGGVAWNWGTLEVEADAR